jgi:hypothetical protein
MSHNLITLARNNAQEAVLRRLYGTFLYELILQYSMFGAEGCGSDSNCYHIGIASCDRDDYESLILYL